jgi:hypothetical protein
LTLATGDVNGDGRADIVTGSQRGANHLRVFQALGLFGSPDGIVSVLLPAYPSANQGIKVGAGDLDNDGRAELFAAPSQAIATGCSSLVQVLDGTGATLGWVTPHAGHNGALALASLDTNEDGRAEIVTGAVNAGLHLGHIKRFDALLLEQDSFFTALGADGSLLAGAR